MKTYIIILLLLFLWGCSEEAEKLDIGRLDHLEISGIEEEIRIQLNDTLVIHPVIKNGAEDDYDYVWYMYDMASPIEDSENDTLGLEKNLKCAIDNRVIRAVDSEHTLVFKAVNKETGVYYVHRSKLFASGIYGLGTFILGEDNNEYKLHFIHRDSRNMVEDVYDAEDGGSLVNPTKVAFVKPLNRYLPELKEVFVFCDDIDGGVVLDPNTFTKTVTFREKVGAEDPGILTPRLHFQNGIYDYLIYNGNSCRKQMSSDVYDPVFAVISEPGDAELAPMVWKILQYYNEAYDSYTSGGPVYYDQKNNRFLEHAIENRGYLREMQNAENSVFDGSNLGEGMEYVCGGVLPGIGNGWILLRESSTNKLWLFKFSTTMTFPDPKDKLHCIVTFTGTEKIELTSQYTAHLQGAKYFSSLYNVEDGIFIFGTETGVYSFNVSLASSANPMSLETELISAMELNGLAIRALEYISYEIEDPDHPFDPFIEKEVRLCVADEAQNDGKEGVIFYQLQTTGGLHLEETFRKMGICDRIIDIEEKFN